MPILDFAGLSQFAGLVVNQARIVVVDPPSDTLYDQIVPFSVDARQIDLNLQVNISGTRQLQVSFELLSGTQVIFTGTQTVTATAGATTPPPPTPIVPTFVGPGTNIGSLLIGPRDTTVLVNATVPFSVSARDSSNNPVAQFYASWTTNSTVHTIDAAGEFQAGSTPGSVWVHAKTPTGIKDSTQIFVQAAPTTATITMSLPGNLVGVGMTGQLTVTLSQPAPTGGVTVTVTSDSTAYITVAAPGTIAFLAGQTSRTITLNGIALGASIIRAAAPGYIAGIFGVVATPPIIVLTNAASVAVSATTTLNIQLLPAPTAATAVTLSSVDPAIATVTPTTVNFAAGQANGTASIQGVAAGTTGILANATGYIQGGSPITVTSGAATPTTLQKQAGDNQTAFINDTTAIRLQARVLDQGGAPMAGISVLFSIGANGGTIGGTTNVAATTNASGIAAPTATWRMGATPATYTIIASIPATPAVTPVTFSATATLPPPVIQVSVLGSTVVGQARTGALNVALLQAAPAGGLTVNLTTKAGLLYVNTYGSENGSVAFLQGETAKQIVVFGDSTTTGIDTIIATGTGYTPDTLAVPVSLSLISLPTTQNVALQQNSSLPINLTVPAPVGGLKVAIQSSDPATVQVLTDTVLIGAGSTVGNATILGVALGSASVIATNPNYAPDAATVSVTATLTILQGSINGNASFGQPLTVQLQSGGIPVGAPASGVSLSLVATNPACAAVPATANIPAGLQDVTVQVTYGGTATLPCNTVVTVSGPPGYVSDNVNVAMAVQPVLTLSNTVIGAGLQRAVNVSLNASNHGGTTVRVTSLKPSAIQLGTTDTSLGASFVDLPIGIGVSNATLYIQGVDGVIIDTSLVTVTAPGFVPDTAAIRVHRPVFDIIGLNATATSLTQNDLFQVRVYTPSDTGATPSQIAEDEIRAHGTARTVSIVNDSAAVANLVILADSSQDSVTIQMAVGQARTPTSVSVGGVEIDYLAAGVARLRASIAGWRPVTNALGANVTVTSPAIVVAGTTIGAGLQRAMNINISAPAPVGGTPIHFVSADPGVLRLSPNVSTAGLDTLTVMVTQGNTVGSFTIQGVEGVLNDTALVTLTSPGFIGDTMQIRVMRPVFDLIGLNASATSLTANDVFQLRVYTPTDSGATPSFFSEDEIRTGGVPHVFSVVNDSAAVANLVILADSSSDSVTVTMAVGQTRTPVTVGTGGVEIDYIAGGVARIRAHSPTWRSVGTALGQNVTVTSPAITIGATIAGAGLQRSMNVGLTATAPAGGVPVRLVSSKPGILLLSPNLTTVGFDTLTVTVPQGNTQASFVIQGIEGVLYDTSFVVATSAGFTPDTGLVRVLRPAFDIIGLNLTGRSLQASDPFTVRLWVPTDTSATPSLFSNDPVRFGGVPAVATITTSASTVGTLITTAFPGGASQVTVTVPVGAFQSPSTVAAGGVEIDYQTTGTTQITVSIPGYRAVGTNPATVTVSASTLNLPGNQTVGSGLQNGAQTATFSDPVPPGGSTVTIKSAVPGRMLVSPNAATAGTDSIQIAVVAGQTNFSFVVAGVEGLIGAGQAVSLTGTAIGYAQDVATVTVVQPGVEIASLAPAGTAATADDPFVVRVGVPNGSGNGLSGVTQQVRIGGSTLTITIQSTTPATGGLTITGQANQPSVTLQLAPGQFTTPASVAVGGVAFDFGAVGSTFVVPAITNYLTQQQTVPGTPGFRVIVN